MTTRRAVKVYTCSVCGKRQSVFENRRTIHDKESGTVTVKRFDRPDGWSRVRKYNPSYDLYTVGDVCDVCAREIEADGSHHQVIYT